MSGPAYHNGDDGGRGDDGDGLPRVPRQRAQHPPGPEAAEPTTPDAPDTVDAVDAPDAVDVPRLEPPAPVAAPDAVDALPPAPPAPTDERPAPAEPPAPAPPDSAPPVPAPTSERRTLRDLDHPTLKSLLGAWALSACSREESQAVEAHLTDCAGCADEARRLRDAVRLLHQEESLDLDPLLRARVLEGCLGRRPARIPMPEWAGPYGAEAARLDALLRDLGDGYWKVPVRLRWFDGAPVSRRFTVGQVIAHLTAVDGLLARALDVPADPDRPGGAQRWAGAKGRHRPGPGSTDLDELPLDPWQRTEAHWSARRRMPGATLRSLWREQSMALVRTVSFAGAGAQDLLVDYGAFSLPLRDAFVDRAFECWIHAGDIADAVDYPYDPPPPRALHRMVDLAARMLPVALAQRRRDGLSESPSRLVAAGSSGRSLRLEIEGDGGGDWYLPLDSPGAAASPETMVAHVAMDSVEFCLLAAGHVEPERAAAGALGDRTAIRDVLYAAASLSRL